MTQEIASQMPDQNHRSYSLRQRLDLVFGVLLAVITWAGCLALGLAQRQRYDSQLLRAMSEQERVIDELTRFGEHLAVSIPTPSALEESSIGTMRAGLVHLSQSLHVLRSGGLLKLDEDRSLLVRPMRGVRMLEQLQFTTVAVDQYTTQLERFLQTPSTADPETGLPWPREFDQRGQELRALIRGLAAQTESQSLTAVLRGSQFLLGLMFSGVLCFLMGAFMLRRLVTTPLHRMVGGIEAMQRTGRLVKLPVLQANELGVVAAAFNQLAAQVEEQKRRLREHIEELQRVNVELEALAKMKDEFLMTINHQLRTPMTTIVEGIQLFRDGTLGPLSEDQQSFIQSMEENAARLNYLIEAVLDLSLLKSGRRPLVRQPGDLTTLLRQVQARWQLSTHVQMIHVACPTLPLVYMDTQAVTEVLDHLLRNALRHAPERSTIYVNAHAVDGTIAIAVRDDGPGMSEEQRTRLFQPFVHVQNPDDPGVEGSGLGLAFCRQVIERHRGTIQADVVEGKGMTVTFTLPVASSKFLFEEACREAQEDAEYAHGQFGVLYFAPVTSSLEHQDASELMQRTETLLRQNTHRGDHFIRLDETTLVIVAVTDRVGLDAMAERLRGVLSRAQLHVALASAAYPADGDESGRLLAAARDRISTLAEMSKRSERPPTMFQSSQPMERVPARDRANR